MTMPLAAGAASSAPLARPRRRFWQRTFAVLAKEFIQLRRDRMSFGMIIMIPLMQLMLFGYAINTNPRHLPPWCCCRSRAMSAAPFSTPS